MILFKIFDSNMGREKNKFILTIIEKVFSFLSKFRCACCNSTCIIADNALPDNTKSKQLSESNLSLESLMT